MLLCILNISSSCVCFKRLDTLQQVAV